MNCIRILGRVGILICFLAACGPSITKTSQVTEPGPGDTHEPTPLPLSEPGPYGVGMRRFTFTDPARDDREVTISVWYPAVQPSGSTSVGFIRDADPDPREAPYPLIF